jgi:hypothetical protein
MQQIKILKMDKILMIKMFIKPKTNLKDQMSNRMHQLKYLKMEKILMFKMFIKPKTNLKDQMSN